MKVCTSLQTDNHASTPPLSFSQAGCPSCSPTNSVEAVKAKALKAGKDVNRKWLTCPLYVRKYLRMCSLEMDGCRATSIRKRCRDRRRCSINSRSVDKANWLNVRGQIQTTNSSTAPSIWNSCPLAFHCDLKEIECHEECRWSVTFPFLRWQVHRWINCDQGS